MIDKNGACCEDIRPILQGIDPLFEIEFNYDNESYIVYFNSFFFMNVLWRDFTRETVEQIYKMYWKNYYGEVFDEVDQHNDKVKKSKERERDGMVHEMAKDLHKAVLKDF